MTKQVLYRYLGTNGVIESPVHLEDIYYTRIISLLADDGKVLINGDKALTSVRCPEEEAGNWKEIPLKGQK